MRNLLPLLFLMSAGLAADKAPSDELTKLDARELHNRGTQRLAEGDLAGAEDALRASLGRDVDPLRPPALHNLGHVRFGKGKVVLGGKSTGDVTELSIARSYLEAADADISDMKDQIDLIDKAKAENREPDYVPATSALGGGINTFRTIKKLIPKEEAMVTKRNGVIAVFGLLSVLLFVSVRWLGLSMSYFFCRILSTSVRHWAIPFRLSSQRRCCQLVFRL